MKKIILAILKACGKYVLILFVWWFLEELCYGEIQHRFVDDVIGNIIFYTLTVNEWNKLKYEKLIELIVEERGQHEQKKK